MEIRERNKPGHVRRTIPEVAIRGGVGRHANARDAEGGGLVTLQVRNDLEYFGKAAPPGFAPATPHSPAPVGCPAGCRSTLSGDASCSEGRTV